MKFSVNSYSFGAYINADRLGIYGVIEKTAAYGFDGIEFTEHYWTDTTDEELRKIGQTARDLGLETVSFCTGADFLNGSEGNLDREVERVCRIVDKAACLGVSMMRHDVAYRVPDRKHGIGYFHLLPRMAEGCRRVTEYAATLGIKTMTENHGFFSQDADRVAALIDAVNSPNFGALVDLGNFSCADEETTLSVSRLAPYAFFVHCKDFLYKKGTEINPGDGWFVTRAGNYLRGTIVGHGEAKIAQSLGMLKRKGYDGFISLEFEGTEDNLVGIKMGLSNIKRFWEMA
jgi:sugar phosphate isomerase/epimerase